MCVKKTIFHLNLSYRILEENIYGKTIAEAEGNRSVRNEPHSRRTSFQCVGYLVM